MSNRLRVIFLFLTIAAVLFVSAIGTTNAYADDGAPPPPDTGEVSSPPEDGGAVVSEPPVVDTSATESISNDAPPAPAEEAPAEDTTVTAEAIPAEAATATETLLEQVPEDTTVTVLNSEGEAQPLTSQDSAAAILVSDPIWCPAGQLPTPGLNGCTTSYNSFTTLLTFLQANEVNAAYQQAGTIYVQMNTYAGGEASIDFNQYNFQNINNYNLTIQGGWDTVDNSLETTDTTQFIVPILIGTSSNPWAGSLTISNIGITNVANQTGLTLFSQGNITLSNVTVANSLAGTDLTASGDVVLQNSSFNNNRKFGATIHAGHDVTISNSKFNGNTSSKYDSYGLKVDSKGSVTLADVTANSNEKFGADISATGQVTVQNSVFSGNVSYSSSSCGGKTANGGYGLQVVTTAPVSLDGVTANDNYLFGAHLAGSRVDVFNSHFNHNGSGSLDTPKGYGLEVLSAGDATLISVEANNNQLFGANIQAKDNVTVINGFFNGNKSYTYSCKGKSYYGYGLQVVTNGNVALNEVAATDNYLYGAHLEGSNIAISSGTFSNNGSDSSSALTGKGLEIKSTSSVSLFNVEANNNQLFGANIQAVGNVAINNGFFNGQQVYTYSCKGKGSVSGGGYGLQVVTQGSIALSDVEASDNYLFGTHLAGADVSVNNGSFENNQAGLNIESSGSVSLFQVTASNNELSGANIDAKNMVSISNSVFSGNQSYTYSSCKGKTFYGYGLDVVSFGPVYLSNVTAEHNNLYGAHVEGTDVAISFSSFSNNGTGVLSDHVGKGLEIKSSGGSVSLYEVTASNNQLFGANIQADGNVSIYNSVFNGNMSYTSASCQNKTYDGYGLQVVTTSDVYLNGVTASQNSLFGAHLEGAFVEVHDSSFNSNSSHSDSNPTGKGLEVKSTGDTLLQSVEANNNQLFGANVQANGKVNVLSSLFAGNQYSTVSTCKSTKGGYGLKVVATGDIFLGPAADAPSVGVQAYDNGAEGIILTGSSAVTVTDSSVHNNGATGLSITANGNVTLTNVSATGNKLNGVAVDGICTNTVYVNGGTFSDNGQYGIKITEATYTPDGTQTFANNHSGNTFQNSSTCFSNATSSSSPSTTHSGSGSWNWWGWSQH